MIKVNGYETIEEYKGFLIVKGNTKKYMFLEPKEKGGFFTGHINTIGQEYDTLKETKQVINNLIKL
jgi:hypothetical protein